MRTYRMGLIQSEEQLRFSYQSIIEGIRQSALRNSATTVETPAKEVSDSSSEDKTLSPLPPLKTESIKKDGSQEEEMVTHKEEVGQRQDRKIITRNNEPSQSREQLNSTPSKIEMKTVKGVSTAVKDSRFTTSSSDSNHSSTVKHNQNKLEERLQYIHNEDILNKNENNEVWSSTAGHPPGWKVVKGKQKKASGTHPRINQNQIIKLSNRYTLIDNQKDSSEDKYQPIVKIKNEMYKKQTTRNGGNTNLPKKYTPIS